MLRWPSCSAGHPQAAFRVAAREADGTPLVIENAPLLDDGTPMPTRFWLVGNRARVLVGRLEAAGGVNQAEADIGLDAWPRSMPVTAPIGMPGCRSTMPGPSRPAEWAVPGAG